jgi:hypothetical protein
MRRPSDSRRVGLCLLSADAGDGGAPSALLMRCPHTRALTASLARGAAARSTDMLSLRSLAKWLIPAIAWTVADRPVTVRDDRQWLREAEAAFQAFRLVCWPKSTSVGAFALFAVAMPVRPRGRMAGRLTRAAEVFCSQHSPEQASDGPIGQLWTNLIRAPPTGSNSRAPHLRPGRACRKRGEAPSRTILVPLDTLRSTSRSECAPAHAD